MNLNLSSIIAAQKKAKEEAAIEAAPAPTVPKLNLNFQTPAVNKQVPIAKPTVQAPPAPSQGVTPVMNPAAQVALSGFMQDALAQAQKLSAQSVSISNEQEAAAGVSMEYVRGQLQELEQLLLTDHPRMPYLLNEIHQITINRDDIATALSDDEIGIIVSCAAKHQQIALAKDVTKKAKNGRTNAAKLSVDDI